MHLIPVINGEGWKDYRSTSRNRNWSVKFLFLKLEWEFRRNDSTNEDKDDLPF